MTSSSDVLELARLREWRRDPAAVPPLEHGAYCTAGLVTFWRYGTYEAGLGKNDATSAMPCPVCGAQRTVGRLRERMLEAGIGEVYLDKDWEDLELLPPLDRIRTACWRISEILLEGHNLLLYGPSGGGKTQAGVLAARAALKAGFSAMVTNLGQVTALALEAQRSGEGKGLGAWTQELQAPDLLVLDDFGAGESESLGLERRLVYLVLEGRQNARRSTLVTSNLTLAELGHAYGGRILQRLEPLLVVHVNHNRNFRLTHERNLWQP